MGQTRCRNEKHTIGNAWEMGLGKTEWMKLAKWKWVFPEAAGCWSVWLEWKCNAVSGVSVRNERSSWDGMERKWKSYTASTWINKQLNVFYFLHNWWVVGKFWGLRAAEWGKGVDLVRLLYIIRLWASLLICRQAREWPLTTCYV